MLQFARIEAYTREKAGVYTHIGLMDINLAMVQSVEAVDYKQVFAADYYLLRFQDGREICTNREWYERIMWRLSAAAIAEAQECEKRARNAAAKYSEHLSERNPEQKYQLLTAQYGHVLQTRLRDCDRNAYAVLKAGIERYQANALLIELAEARWSLEEAKMQLALRQEWVGTARTDLEKAFYHKQFTQTFAELNQNIEKAQKEYDQAMQAYERSCNA
ncbi:MAG: hypothetical protein BWY07_02001 [Candidatus Hydrogenedentes bacterium ADurb.Bin170]|nr:MAG: hypothetical protein BWY07_02001 [Candidatus Hydrogenedentes bacterium ADurb.Bin170]